MKTWSNTLFVAAIGLLAALPAFARSGGRDIQGWMDRQQYEIQRGIDSGELTKREARHLKREQRDIRELGDRLRSEGYSPHEARRMIEDRLRDADRHISDLRYNDEVAYGPDHYRRPPPPPGGRDDYPRPERPDPRYR